MKTARQYVQRAEALEKRVSSIKDDKTKNKALELIAEVEDDNLGWASMLVRGIDVNLARNLIEHLTKKLPKLYLTLHHAEGHQVHPRLRGWSKSPKISPQGHPDWGTQRDIALFEAYIGKPREYWYKESGKIFVEKPIEERITEDREFVEKEILKGYMCCALYGPKDPICQWTSSGAEWVWARKGTKLYKRK